MLCPAKTQKRGNKNWHNPSVSLFTPSQLYTQTNFDAQCYINLTHLSCSFQSHLTRTSGLIWHNYTAQSLRTGFLMIQYCDLTKLLSVFKYLFYWWGQEDYSLDALTFLCAVSSCCVWTQQKHLKTQFMWQDLHYGTDSSTVTLPHAPEPRLTSNIPQLQTQGE